jgi:hypothetical protein
MDAGAVAVALPIELWYLIIGSVGSNQFGASVEDRPLSKEDDRSCLSP